MYGKRLFRNCILILFFLFFHSKAYATTSCSPVTVTAPTFPSVTANSGITTSPAVQVTLNCTGPDSVAIAMGSGTHYLSNTRNLMDSESGSFVPYLIRNFANNALWGDSSTPGLGSRVLTNQFVTPQNATFTVNVPAGIPSGTYTDQITITLSDSFGQRYTTLIISLTVINSCNISSNPTPINFGSTSAGSFNVVSSQTATISITCTNSISYFWGANAGTNWLGSRRMKAATSNTYISYKLEETGNLLGDAGMQNYGGTNTTDIPYRTATGNNSQQTYTITATVTTNPIPSIADSYSDTVFYTVAW